MKAILLLTASGAVVFLSTYPSLTHPGLLKRLKRKGIGKFIAYEIPLELARQRYAGHFFVVEQDLDDIDDLRVLDLDGQRAFRLFRFEELGAPLLQEAEAET
ncbi:Cytosolic protein [Rhodovastum atsumiense]|uniref:Cytosolic protein n=1 Tax=Rhodovastum atsumiense TaxID=504468 RepID=A0A5M6IRU3_9PROT|nr:cytosolic protein [Rhodovastum atsumiense]KAA5610617.1 cytosolic protein [Rhodovastum atsumiense]CAH2600736.1 Cytosolic protein [Rhodovastum atsumiense]